MTIRLLASGLAALLLSLPAYAARVLTPAAGAQLEAAVHRVPGLRLEDGKIQPDAALLRLCMVQTCTDLRLTDATTRCDGEKSGLWCVNWPSEPPSWAHAFALSLAAPATAAEAASIEELPVRVDRTRHDVALFFLAWWLVPLLAGLALGRLFVRARGGRLRGWLGAIALLALPTATCLAATVLWRRMGLWDLVGIATVLALGLLLAAHRAWVPDRRWLLGGLPTVCGLLLLEGLCRTVLPMPPAFPPPELAELWQDLNPFPKPGSIDPSTVCQALYPTTIAPLPADAGLEILHIGDSMAAFAGTTPSERFDHHLPAAWRQLNAAVGGTATDAQLLVLRQQLQQRKPKLVILHVCSNDLSELGRHYHCCVGQPLLQVPDRGPPMPNCPQPQWSSPLRVHSVYFAESPPPYPLRVATAVSFLARSTDAAWIRAIEWCADIHPLTKAESIRQFRRLIRAFAAESKAAGSDFVAVLMPVRQTRNQQEDLRPLYLDLFRQEQIELLDANPVFQEKTASGERLYSDEPPGDIHLNAAGHRLFARWLEPLLRPRVER